MTAELIKSARRLVGAAKRKPSQADLRRAVSTAYYATFDALARLCADEVVGSSPAKRGLPEWRRVYRNLNHGRSQEAYRELAGADVIDERIEDFCSMIETLRLRRLEADYDPAPLKLKRADIALLIDEADLVITGLLNAAAAQRRALAFACLLTKRKIG